MSRDVATMTDAAVVFVYGIRRPAAGKLPLHVRHKTLQLGNACRQPVACLTALRLLLYKAVPGLVATVVAH